MIVLLMSNLLNSNACNCRFNECAHLKSNTNILVSSNSARTSVKHSFVLCSFSSFRYFIFKQHLLDFEFCSLYFVQLFVLFCYFVINLFGVMDYELPYKISYSEGGIKCKRCRHGVPKGKVCIAIMMQVRFYR